MFCGQLVLKKTGFFFNVKMWQGQNCPCHFILRKYYMTSDIEWLQGQENWVGLKSIGMVESTREIKGEISKERRY